jgi:hypothetical protein
MKRALLGTMAAIVVAALATEVPGLSRGTREAFVWPIAMGVALLPSLAWLTLGCALGGSCL